MEEETLEGTNRGMRCLKKKEPERSHNLKRESTIQVKRKAFPMKRDQ